MMRQIERKGTVTGRWQKYSLTVNGILVGSVKRVFPMSTMIGTHGTSNDGWLGKPPGYAQGMLFETREQAEAQIIQWAVRDGLIPLEPDDPGDKPLELLAGQVNDLLKK
jgi:hypothetical protein